MVSSPMANPLADELIPLKEMLCRKSLRFGDFTLASGAKSDVYVDGKLTTCSPEAMPLIGRAFLRKIRALGWRPEAVGGLTLGADPIAYAIARESLDEGPVVGAFIIRKEAKKHGTERFIEGLEQTEGRQVVIVEDVCTKGGSTAQAIEKAVAAGMKVIGAICLVDREMGGAALLRQNFGLDLASLFKLSDLQSFKQTCR